MGDSGGDSSAEREQFRRLDELGTAIRASLHSLSIDEQAIAPMRALLDPNDRVFSQADYPHLARLLASHEVVRDSVRIALAFDAVDQLLPTAEDRAETLIQLLAQRELSERAKAYLDRATRLFLWGFDPECIIMAHAVLEAALEEVIPDLQLFAQQITKKGNYYTAKDRIDAAGNAGILTEEQASKADDLRRARNDNIHNAPHTAGKAEEAVRLLAELLNAIFPASPA